MKEKCASKDIVYYVVEIFLSVSYEEVGAWFRISKKIIKMLMNPTQLETAFFKLQASLPHIIALYESRIVVSYECVVDLYFLSLVG